MIQTDNQNETFALAADLVNNTNYSIFLTGKAGTGKTTFLKYIKANTRKNTVVVAPTGVAAINAGGVTMHSFFQLPFGPYVPQSFANNKFVSNTTDIADRNTLFKNIRFDKNKRTLLNELELLIIDEVSMVRVDMLDALDAILRYFRKAMHLPFGGVQVLFIGDMYQLPPVIKDAEWNILQDYYDSPFFFDAQVCKEYNPLYIELQKIYRQQDQKFIDILNKVRNNIPSNDDLEILNDLFSPTVSETHKDAILLTTHNAKADAINEQELYKMNTPAYTFKGIIEGEFNDKLLPNELELELKEGAKIMFIRNDSSPEKKYFNGKLAIIKKIVDEKIMVQCIGEEEIFVLKHEEWKNIRYKLTEANQIDEEELGSYTQYPVRLAWAVTIHKSQGLTFDKVIIDAGRSFAAGQVYVALSRCTSLEGIVLHSKIDRAAINTDERIIKFSKSVVANEELQRILALEKEAYLQKQLLKQFDLVKLVLLLEEFKELVPQKKLPNQVEAIRLSTDTSVKANELQIVMQKFVAELKFIVENNKEKLSERIEKAQHYFNEHIILHIYKPLHAHIQELKSATKVRQYLKAVNEFLQKIYTILVQLNTVHYGDTVYNKYLYAIEKYNVTALKNKTESKVGGNEEKVPSAELSYQMYLEEKDIARVALKRNLANGTVEGHLAQYVRNGKININELVPPADVSLILEVLQKVDSRSTTEIKQHLPTEISHGAVRAVMNYRDWAREQYTKADD